MRHRTDRIAAGIALAVVLAGTCPLLAQNVTPWQIGDVFVGVGSSADAPGIYKTLAPTGGLKLDAVGQVVPDLVSGAVPPTFQGWSTNCAIDPNPSPSTPGGDLWTTAWTDGVLSHFNAQTHALIDSFAFFDATTGFPTPLAAMPRDPGVAPLPQDAIGPPGMTVFTGNGILAPNPGIQSFEQVILATSGPYKGQLYVGTGVPPANDQGRGFAYLLRFRYDGTNPTPSQRLILTGWWYVDAGSINGGPSPSASGVDEFDLSSDQETIFYTSEDKNIRSFNVVTGVQGPTITLTQRVGTDAAGNPIWGPVDPFTRSYGVRALPGAVDANGNLNPTAPGDGSAGFIVATNNNFVYRTDRAGHIVYRYPLTGRPSALALTPDAQYFWTATTQDNPGTPLPNGGQVFKVHVASGSSAGPFSPFAGGGLHGVYGMCVKREYYAGGSQCFAMNPDGTPQLSGGAPIAIACTTPTLCSQDARGVAITGNSGDCFPAGTHAPVFPDRTDTEGAIISYDLTAANPGLVITNVTGLPQGLTFANGIVSGTISPTDCAPSQTRCAHLVSVTAHLKSDEDPVTHAWTVTDNAQFTWNVLSVNFPPTISVDPKAVTTSPVLQPLTINLLVGDPEADDVLILRASSQPPGMSVTARTGYGIGYAASLSGIPQFDPPYDHVYQPHIDLFDCSGAWADANAAGASVATLTNAMTTGGCYHHVTLDFTLTVVRKPPTFSAAIPDQFDDAGSAIPGVTVTATDAPALLPLTFTVTGLPAGLDYCHVDATGVCPAGAANPHAAVGSNTNPAAQSIHLFGTPTTPVTNRPVAVQVSNLSLGTSQTTFQWTIHGAPVLNLADQYTLLTTPPTPVTYQVGATSPNGFAIAYPASVGGLPPGIAWSQASHAFSGTPTTTGIYPISVTVADVPPAGRRALSATSTFTWKVNRRPTIAGANQVTRINTIGTYQINGVDPGDTLTYALVSPAALPAWLQWNAFTHTFTASPHRPDAGASVSLVVSVTDSFGEVATSAPFTWTVTKSRPPGCDGAEADVAEIGPQGKKRTRIVGVRHPDRDDEGDTCSGGVSTEGSHDRTPRRVNDDRGGEGSTRPDGPPMAFAGAPRASASRPPLDLAIDVADDRGRNVP